MVSRIIARNYAETLLALARRHGDDETIDEYGRVLEQVAALMRAEPSVRRFLSTPRIDSDARMEALKRAFGGRVPDLFQRFLLVVVEKRRQMLLPQISTEYRALVDELRGRVRADVTIAREAGQELRDEIVTALERRIGKSVAATFRVDPAIVGGTVIRVGDQILDGSVRHRIGDLRRRMVASRLPSAVSS
jgi:F-type H+-transporting ATPase subunit delta